MSNFSLINRDTGFLLPPSVDEWLAQRHLARFVVDVVEGLDLRAMTGSYRGSGEASYHPQLLLGLMIYGYATGVFSSRKLERATYDSVASCFTAANASPDHDTIATFRLRLLKQIEAQLQAEVSELMARAEAVDQADVPDGMQIPEKLARREKRLAAIACAKATIEVRAKERHARERAEHDAHMAARAAKTAAKTAATGKKPDGPCATPAGRGAAAHRPGQSDGWGKPYHASGER